MDLRGMEKRLQGSKLRTRFAPTPSGYLHLGHVAHCIYVWGIARSLGGTVVMRMEDHDRQRVRFEYIESILQDLEWLGFLPDEGYSLSDEDSPYLQSAVQEPYHKALKLLHSLDCTYFCTCSRKQLKERLFGGLSTLTYDGYCRNRLSQEQQETSIRLKVPDTQLIFWDGFLGRVVQNPEEDHGDLLLVDKRKNFSYNFSVVIDDLRHGVNTIIRGLDLLPATGVQLYLRQLLAPKEKLPIFAHHPLLYQKQNPQQKLSKRNWDESISSLRERKFSPSRLIGQVAYELGLINNEQELQVGELKNLWGT